MKRITSKSFNLIESNHIIIECIVNNICGKFIVDTGASNSCINYLSAPKFNVESRKSNETASSATNKIIDTYYSKDNTLKIGNFQKNDFDLVLFDMTFINNSLKEKGMPEVDGIIGGDILNQYNACIDYKKEEISLEF